MKSDGNEVAVESIELARGFSNSLIFTLKRYDFLVKVISLNRSNSIRFTFYDSTNKL
jgi:hypothetical protein